MHRFKFEKLIKPIQWTLKCWAENATKNPYIDPKLNKHKNNWLYNFNGGI
jgi:hypothetical protein